MEFPPESWDVFEADDFGTAGTRNPGDCGAELMAQVRPNGRIVDHWRVALGGVRILDAKLALKRMVPAAERLPAWTVHYQKWPADLQIRRNMTTSPWFDILELLTANEVTVTGPEDEPVATDALVMALNEVGDKSSNSASLRWAVVVSAAGKLELSLQCLPAPLHCLSKPIFKR